MLATAAESDHRRWMQVALNIGQRHLGQTWPNPSVGCVLVKDNRVIARAVTGQGGRPHAESLALGYAGRRAKGCMAYITLEPCAHSGETPACAKLLVEAGVKRVIVAVKDPDDRVSGKGIEILKSAGIDVITGVLEDEARQAHRGFFSRIVKNRPSITLKLAMSFDGKVATQSGHSKWITGTSARRYVHLLRSQYDAVMVGRGTAGADDPNLAPREIGIDRSPVRIIIDSKLSTSHRSQLGTIARHKPVWLCHSNGADKESVLAWQARSCAETIRCRSQSGMVNLKDALDKLANRGLTRIFCEGGPALAASLLAGQFVDEIVGFSAGVNLGAEGLSSVGPLGLQKLSDGHRFDLQEVRSVGEDILHRWVRIEVQPHV